MDVHQVFEKTEIINSHIQMLTKKLAAKKNALILHTPLKILRTPLTFKFSMFFQGSP